MEQERAYVCSNDSKIKSKICSSDCKNNSSNSFEVSKVFPCRTNELAILITDKAYLSLDSLIVEVHLLCYFNRFARIPILLSFR
jgi:hypothetical protein